MSPSCGPSAGCTHAHTHSPWKTHTLIEGGVHVYERTPCALTRRHKEERSVLCAGKLISIKAAGLPKNRRGWLAAAPGQTVHLYLQDLRILGM